MVGLDNWLKSKVLRYLYFTSEFPFCATLYSFDSEANIYIYFFIPLHVIDRIDSHNI